MKASVLRVVGLLVALAPAVVHAADSSPAEALSRARRVVVLGDSITAGGQYVAGFDAWLVSRKLPRTPEVLNLGLASETVSGLSEEGHAGGAFPRPELFERLDRVLALTQPDLVIACYGMNCGIYQPLDAERFACFQKGFERLKEAVERSGATLVIVTPPCYDSLHHADQSYYNGVLERYSQWLLQQRERGWLVIDLHGPMTAELQRRRAADPAFAFQPDGVHPDRAGHWFMARQIIRGFGDAQAAAAQSPEAMLAARGIPAEVYPLVEQRMAILRDAYVAAAGHRRPGVARGLPLDEARIRAAELTAQIGQQEPIP